MCAKNFISPTVKNTGTSGTTAQSFTIKNIINEAMYHLHSYEDINLCQTLDIYLITSFKKELPNVP